MLQQRKWTDRRKEIQELWGMEVASKSVRVLKEKNDKMESQILG